MTDQKTIFLHQYPRAALLPDYGRALLGIGCCGAPLLFVEPGSVMFYILSGLTGLFALFGGEVALRQTLRLERNDAGLNWRGLMGAKRLDWADLREVNLRYFSAQREGKNGWLQLTLSGSRPGSMVASCRLKVNSPISGFDDLLGAALAAAGRNKLELSAATRANLAAIGTPLPQGLSGVAS